jgi:hypothetical protein
MRIAASLLCISLIFSAAPAADPAPQSPTDTYISARDRAIADFRAHGGQNWDQKRFAAARAEPERLLRAAVPAWNAPGFPKTGTINVSVYDDPELGFSVLDGLVYEAHDTAVLVTNRALLQRWLADRRKAAGRTGRLPAAIPAAFRSQDFWTFALASDAAAQLRGQLLVKVPPGNDMAVASIAVFAQDLAMDELPDTLLVAVVRGDRVFVARQKLAAALTKPALCKSNLDRARLKSAAALKAYQETLKSAPEGKAKDTSRFDQSVALDERADSDYRACFAQQLIAQSNYGAIAKQAQTLVDLLH